ncbi:MAG: hypothetical protein ACLGIR_10575 [Actinomycetes bacterium]
MGIKQRVKAGLEAVLPDAAFERLDQAVDLQRHERWRRAWAREHGLPTVPVGTVLFHPNLPTEWHIAWKLTAAAGYRITNDPTDDVVAAFRWFDTTVWESDDVLADLAARVPVVNLHCEDISKSRVNEVFAATFGYELGVDPTTHEGPMVAKSEENATHDGVVLTGPIAAREPGVSYQRLVDNHVAGDPGTVEVWRTPLVAGEVPLVYRKQRPVAERLTNASFGIEVHEPADVYSAEELGRLAAFAHAFHLDHGEADVLRDTDGRIYVVDANNTPWGPPRALDEAGSRRAVEVMAPRFGALLRGELPLGGAAAS